MTTSSAYLTKVKGGTSSSFIPIRFSTVWKDTIPVSAVNNAGTVDSTLTSAKVTIMSYVFKNLVDKTRAEMQKLELDLEKKIFGVTREYVEVNVFTISGNTAAFSEDI